MVLSTERVFSSYGLSVVFSSWRSKGAPHVIDVHVTICDKLPFFPLFLKKKPYFALLFIGLVLCVFYFAVLLLFVLLIVLFIDFIFLSLYIL